MSQEATIPNTRRLFQPQRHLPFLSRSAVIASCFDVLPCLIIQQLFSQLQTNYHSKMGKTSDSMLKMAYSKTVTGYIYLYQKLI